MDKSIYSDIATRTNGDIYIGVVGPVRTGKSTFISQFMNKMVIPKVEDNYMRERAIDELPQSSAGRTIMTTEPKFIPEEAIKISTEDGAQMKVRLIDCVGYIVPSAIGYIEDDKPRMVVTPWMDKEIPFNMAAEIGTQKVINEHSTIGMVITTDGSVADIPREEYIEAEQRVITELKAINKPFIVLLNCANPTAQNSIDIAREMTNKYSVAVLPVNCMTMDEQDIKNILKTVLYEFPVKEIAFDIPSWVMELADDHWLKSDIMNSVKESTTGVHTIGQSVNISQGLMGNQYITGCDTKKMDLSTGEVQIWVQLDSKLFYTITSESIGMEIESESQLVSCIIELAKTKKEYDKIKTALAEVEATGYGIVMPDMEALQLEEPEMVKQGGKYGVKLRASAPSIHMMRADITTQVSPIVGSEKQSEELVEFLLSEFQDDPRKIWDSNIFGKSLYDLVGEGLHGKLYRMPTDARMKIQETLERIINEGCTGLICIIL